MSSRWIFQAASIVLILAKINVICCFSPSSVVRKAGVVRFQNNSIVRKMSDNGNKNDGVSIDAGALGSALVRLDREWQKNPGALVAKGGGAPGASTWKKLPLQEDSEEFVYLLEPPFSTSPSVLICFTGGAVLGQFPHIAYSEMLQEISRRLNASIIAAPYQITNLDHFALAKQTGELLRKGIITCQDTKLYGEDIPKFFLGHSLGCKLQTISLAATGIGTEFSGIGYISFNNFGFTETIGMAKSFAKEFQQNQSPSSQPDGMMDMLFEFAEQAMGMVGLEFTPNPNDTNRIISMKYDADLQSKTRLFVFDEDNLDNSADFVNACNSEEVSSSLAVSGLDGSHLTPVYLKLDINDFDIPDEAQYVVSDFTNNIQQVSFGDEEKMKAAAKEVCDWILGKSPSRPPIWNKSQQRKYNYESTRRIEPGIES